MIQVKNNDTVSHIYAGQEILAGEDYTLQTPDYETFRASSSLFSDVGLGVALVGDGSTFFTNPTEGWQYLMKDAPARTTTAGEVVLEWTQFYSLWLSVKAFAHTYCVDCGDKYFVWLLLNGSEVYCPNIVKNTADCTSFETYMKPSCNPNEALRIRVTTCKLGRAMHQRYIAFTTALPGSVDNTNYLENDYGDVTYTMKKRTLSNGVYTWTTTTNSSECNETWVDWEPTFDYEIFKGELDIAKTLVGDAWECHVIAVPDVPANYGGCIELVSNPRIKWKAGTSIGIDASLNPKEMRYSATLHSNKIRAIIKHPAGANSEFQLCLSVFK